MDYFCDHFCIHCHYHSVDILQMFDNALDALRHASFQVGIYHNHNRIIHLWTLIFGRTDKQDDP